MNGAGKRFMELTTYGKMTEAPQRKGMPQPPLERPAEAGAEPIPLPDALEAGIGQDSFFNVMSSRRSLRAYRDAPLALAELSYLLWSCQGVQEKSERHTVRTVPSAGARHAFEAYVLVNRVQALDPGLYRYLALSHALLLVDLSGGMDERLKDACLNQGMVAASAVTVFFAAELERMYYRYGERGYRYLFLDAGHACQNLCLAAETIGCGACAIGAFDDDTLNKELGLDGVERFVVYGATIGKKL